ncbi:hypothetical protein LOTGIDRAFT_156595 [Lottia gigantea]|uniref:Uncharacterized protein n=1 Tax=Lottia gigantea TaxID=225164 RepID=V4B9E0_LOTGI|nr:hypothetical protein LOTGIDRAFT_156595 [Lottia gigantea]ESP03991.1 hypothetical protein LOTGIDRAFT_156595 [Lottia gigantea]
MAAVGDNACLDGEDDPKNGEDGLVNLCKKNGINHTCFLGDNFRDSVEARIMKVEKLTRLNGTSKSHSLLQSGASFTKPTLPTLRSRKEKVSPEICRRKRRSSKHESPEQKDIFNSLLMGIEQAFKSERIEKYNCLPRLMLNV